MDAAYGRTCPVMAYNVEPPLRPVTSSCVCHPGADGSTGKFITVHTCMQHPVLMVSFNAEHSCGCLLSCHCHCCWCRAFPPTSSLLSWQAVMTLMLLWLKPSR